MSRNHANAVAFFAAPLGTEINERLWDVVIKTRPKAVVMETFGSGSVPNAFLGKVRATTHEGIPVFIVNGLEGTLGLPPEQSFGIVHITYDTNRQLLDAGAIPLESVNVGHLRRFVEFRGTHPPETEYPGKPTDNILETIGEIIESDGGLFERIKRIRKVYELSDAEIERIERQSHRLEPHHIPVEVRPLLSAENAEEESLVSLTLTKEQILKSRQAVDAMLHKLEMEMQERSGEGGIKELKRR